MKTESEDPKAEEPQSEALVKTVTQPPVPIGMSNSYISKLKDFIWMGQDGTVYPPMQVEIFLKKISLGISRDLALACSGLESSVVDFWLEDGKNSESPYRNFRIFYNRTIAEAESTILESIQRSSDFQYQAAREYLKLLNPEKYETKKESKQEDHDMEPTRVVILKEGYEEP